MVVRAIAAYRANIHSAVLWFFRFLLKPLQVYGIVKNGLAGRLSEATKSPNPITPQSDKDRAQKRHIS